MEKELCQGFYQTPPLWINEQFGVAQFRFPEINLNSFRAKEIPERLRLGHKMEHAFEQLLQFSEDWSLLAKNIVVKKGKISLGELDFLLTHETSNTHYHVELTYKFYIINPEITEPMHRLMGPNKRDMFYTKLDKLKEKQFPLLYSAELEENLNTLQIDTSQVIQQACFKAQLFMPYKNHGTSIRPLNKNCIHGSWIRFDDFNSTEFKRFEYYTPYKQEWVLTPSLKRNYHSHYNTLLDLNLRMLKENAPMLWVKKDNATLEKLFVVWW